MCTAHILHHTIRRNHTIKLHNYSRNGVRNSRNSCIFKRRMALLCTINRSQCMCQRL